MSKINKREWSKKQAKKKTKKKSNRPKDDGKQKNQNHWDWA